VRLAVAVIVLAVTGSALAAPVPEPDGYRMDDYRAPVPDAVPGGVVLHVPAVRKLIGEHEAVLIDVLPAPRRPASMRPEMPWIPQPHRTLPGSLWWPDVGRGGLPQATETRFRERLHEVAGEPPRLLVFFCLSNCWMSWNAAKRAASYGLRVGWFPDGADGWEAAGLPLETVAPEWLD
jgi:PQQ-dependent catabolism-associated CXXCW motif protein